MVNRLIEPFFSFVDSTGAPRESYRLFFYAHGTSTKLDVYTDADGTISANPLTLNSLGQCPNDVFGQNLAYKIVLASPGSNDPPTGSEVETYTNVSTSDFTARAKFSAYNGNPNTHVAGTAGTGSTPADAIWDYTNGVLYFCTSTNTDPALAVWTAYNPSSSVAVVPPPQGRLTLSSGLSFPVSGVTAGTAVYYTPVIGNLCPVYSGTAFVATTFTERTLTLVASHVANAIYDVFGFSDSGTFTIGTGPSWTTVTAGSGARGTGAGTTELTRLNGVWVNAQQVTARNSSTTYTVAANKGTYLGTIAMDGTNGQISCLFVFGQSRKWGVWNAYNRERAELTVGDSTGTWTYATTVSTRAANNTAANAATIVIGLQEDFVDVEYVQQVLIGGNTASVQLGFGVGFNSTSAFSGASAQYGRSDLNSNNTMRTTCAAALSHIPAIGTHTYTALENVSTASGTSPNATYVGGSNGMNMIVKFSA